MCFAKQECQASKKNSDLFWVEESPRRRNCRKKEGKNDCHYLSIVLIARVSLTRLAPQSQGGNQTLGVRLGRFLGLECDPSTILMAWVFVHKRILTPKKQNRWANANNDVPGIYV